MRIIDKTNALNEAIELILNKARFQKVIFCIDETSDINLIDGIMQSVERKTVAIKYYYNRSTIDMFKNMASNGTRVIVYNVSLMHYYNLRQDSQYLLNVFIPQSNFILPYVDNGESLYGANLIVCNKGVKDYTSLILLYDRAIQQVWNRLIQETEIDTNIFKRIDAVVNNKQDCYLTILEQSISGTHADKLYMEVEESQIPYYIFLRLCAILKMLENISNDKEDYIDFYKNGLSVEDVEKAHSLLIKCDIIELIKLNNYKLIKLITAVLNRLKIIIKKYFNFKNIKLNKLNQIIKLQSKSLNIDNLLYLPYIFNTI